MTWNMTRSEWYRSNDFKKWLKFKNEKGANSKLNALRANSWKNFDLKRIFNELVHRQPALIIMSSQDNRKGDDEGLEEVVADNKIYEEDKKIEQLIRQTFICPDPKQYETTTSKTLEKVYADRGYVDGRNIGEGGFGTVYKTTRKSDKKDMAVKKCDLTKTKHSPEELTNEEKERIFKRHWNDQMKELTVYVNLSKKNKYIPELYDYFVIDRYFYIFVELADGGALSDYVKNRGPLKGKARWA